MNTWEQLYAVQDQVLECLRRIEHGFYLTGGTALSRGYFNHRYSEDLDFFVNDRVEFELWRDRCLHVLQQECASRAGWSVEILLRESRFGRAVLRGTVALKLEFVNDVPFRVGEPVDHRVLGKLDTKENILANKITALMDRGDPKDAVDIFWLCCRDGLSIEDSLENAGSKAAGVFAPLVAKRLAELSERGLPSVHWIQPLSEKEFVYGLRALSDALLLL
jgi:hypothetical protein